MMRIAILIIFCLTCSFNAFAQSPDVPTPATATDENSIFLTGGTAHLGNGEVIKSSVIHIKDGKLEMVEDMSKIRIDTKGSKVIKITGKHVYPGLIAMNTNIGLNEVGSIRATRDAREVGGLNPNVRSIIAYNTDSRVTPTVRSNGVTMAQVVPAGGLVSGQSSVVALDAWNYEDAAYATDEGMFINWPRMIVYKGWWAEPGGIEANKKYPEQVQKVRALFDEAQAYCKDKNHQPENLKLQAMCRMFSNSQKLYVRVNFIKEIIDAVNFAKAYNLELVVVGGTDAWMATDILKENNVAVVLNKTHRLPNRADEDVDLPFKLPQILKDAGITVAITVGDGWDGFWDQRNLAFEAGTAAAYGLSKEEALQTITLNPAKILGIDETVGTLEKGKDATIIVSTGDVMDMRSSHIEHAFIKGREINLDNKQKALYRKFMTKYGLKHKQH